MFNKRAQAIGIVFLTIILSSVPFFSIASRTKNNPSLEVEFFICNTYDVPHIVPIVQELQHRGITATCFVKKPKTFFKNKEEQKESKDHYTKVINTAKEYGLTVQDKSNLNADIVLASQRSYQVRKYHNMKVKIGYGASPQIDNNQQTPRFIEGFDGFLIHGQFEIPHYIHAFSKDRLKIMGAPKYVSFFQNPPNKETLKQKWNLATHKKIILYLPTWNAGQSIDLFEHAITSLKEDYVIITKPHGNTFKYSASIPHREKLYKMSTCLIDGNTSLAELAILADLIITDIKSGATTEAIYLTQGNTPWIGLTSLQISEYYPEVVAAGPVLNDPSQLKTTIESILNNDTYHNQRVTLGYSCYSNPSGPKFAAQDAANAIIEFTQMQSITQNYPYFSKKLEHSIDKRVTRVKDFLNQ